MINYPEGVTQDDIDYPEEYICARCGKLLRKTAHEYRGDLFCEDCIVDKILADTEVEL